MNKVCFSCVHDVRYDNCCAVWEAYSDNGLDSDNKTFFTIDKLIISS